VNEQRQTEELQKLSEPLPASVRQVLRGDRDPNLNQGLFDAVSDQKDFTVFGCEHALCDAVVEEGDELVVKAIDVEQDDGLCVEFKCVPGKNLEELFKGAKAPR
jgi:hypothetical protein